MRADPELDNIIWCRHSNRPVMESNTGRPETAYPFEMQRRMVRVSLQEFKRFVGLFTDWSGKSLVAGPEI